MRSGCGVEGDGRRREVVVLRRRMQLDRAYWLNFFFFIFFWGW
jgi:hypothetical protein